LNGSGDTYYLGNVGVGMSSPDSPLSIQGNGGTRQVGITQNRQGGNKSMEFTTSDSIGNQAVRLALTGGIDDSSISFYQGPGGSETEVMRIEKDELTMHQNTVIIDGVLEIGQLAVGGPTTSGGTMKLDVQGYAAGPDNAIAAYIARIKNTNTNREDNAPSVLWLEVAVENSQENTNYIHFVSRKDGSTKSVGRIEGHGDYGVHYRTGGEDFAEELERVDFHEEMEPGDVVGVFGGRISKRTEGADWVMAISGNAGFIGGMGQEEEEAENPREVVAFVGQVKVKVRGAVNRGDYILASGLQDGTAIAVAPSKLQPEQSHLIIGRGWEDARGELNLVNTAVGLPNTASTTQALLRRINGQQTKLEAQHAKLEIQQAEIDTLKEQAARITLVEHQLAGLVEKLETLGYAQSVRYFEE